MQELKQNANVVDAINNSTEEVMRQSVEAITNGASNITVIELPQKGSPSEFKVSEWTEFYLSDTWSAKADQDRVPYPKEFFIVSHIYRDDDGKPEAIRIMGSMGGGYDKIPWNTPNLIKRVSKKM